MKRKLAAVFLTAALVASGSSLAWAAEGEESAEPIIAEEGAEPNEVKEEAVEPLLETGEEATDKSRESGSPAADEEGGEEGTLPDQGSDADSETVTATDENGLTWTLTDGVLTISGSGVTGRSPFDVDINRKITSVVIADGVTGIEDGTFDSFDELYENIAEVSIPDSVTKIGKHAFSYCRNLASVTIPDSVSEIGGYAFYGCSSLTNVAIPSSVTEISAFAFYGCSSLTDIVIPNSVTQIAYRAFAYCEYLPEVTIPESVESIGDGIFANCTGLKKVMFSGDAPSLDYGDVRMPLEPFENVTATAHIPKEGRNWTEEIRKSLGSKLSWAMPKTDADTNTPASTQRPASTSKVQELRIVPEATDNIYVIGSGEGATIKCTGELKDFVSVYVDDQEVDKSNYTLKEGSTVLTFLTKYLDTLSVGKHKVTMNYTYGSVDTELNVLSKAGSSAAASGALTGITASNGSSGTNGSASWANRTGASGNVSSPKTGDQTTVLLWMLVAASAAGIGAAAIRRRQAA